MPVKSSDDSLVDAFDEVASLGVGLGLIFFVLFPLAVPVLVLALVFGLLLALPAVPLALVGGLLAAPVLLVRRLARRRSEASR